MRMFGRIVIGIMLVWMALRPAPSACQAGPETVQTHLERAQQQLRNNRPDLAIPEFRAALKLDSNNLDARTNLGVLEFFSGQPAAAVQDLRGALALNADMPKIRALLGLSEQQIGEWSEAQADLEKSFPHLEDQKFKVQAGLKLIEVDYALRDLPKAAEIVNALRQITPTDPDILYTAHRIYSDLTDETTLSLALVAPDSARMHQLMAHELARQAKDEAAIANYREALKINPKLPDVHYELAEMLYTQSAPDSQAAAEKEYQLALAANPNDPKSESRLGDIAVKRSDLKSAQTHYLRALQLQPNDPDANLGLGKVLMSLHRPQEALEPLRQAAQLEPFNAATHYRLGVLYRELGRVDDSKRELTEFEKLKRMKARLGEVYQGLRVQQDPQAE
jgi:tetratricopeptide (TPR) repeat protein